MRVWCELRSFFLFCSVLFLCWYLLYSNSCGCCTVFEVTYLLVSCVGLVLVTFFPLSPLLMTSTSTLCRACSSSSSSSSSGLFFILGMACDDVCDEADLAINELLLGRDSARVVAVLTNDVDALPFWIPEQRLFFIAFLSKRMKRVWVFIFYFLTSPFTKYYSSFCGCIFWEYWERESNKYIFYTREGCHTLC